MTKRLIDKFNQIIDSSTHLDPIYVIQPIVFDVCIFVELVVAISIEMSFFKFLFHVERSDLEIEIRLK